MVVKKTQRGGFFFGPLFSMLTNSLKGGGVVKKRKKRKRKTQKKKMKHTKDIKNIKDETISIYFIFTLTARRVHQN